MNRFSPVFGGRIITVGARRGSRGARLLAKKSWEPWRTISSEHRLASVVLLRGLGPLAVRAVRRCVCLVSLLTPVQWRTLTGQTLSLKSLSRAAAA